MFPEAEKVYRTHFVTGTYLDSAGAKAYHFTVVADAADKLRFPTDLDVNPLRPNELWVANYGEAYKPSEYSSKAFTLTLFNPGTSTQVAVRRKDKETFTRHFFFLPH